jgi:hypothetical protein
MPVEPLSVVAEVVVTVDGVAHHPSSSRCPDVRSVDVRVAAAATSLHVALRSGATASQRCFPGGAASTSRGESNSSHLPGTMRVVASPTRLKGPILHGKS